MNSPRLKVLLLLLIAVLISGSLTGCATNKFKLEQAYTAKVKVDAAKEAMAKAEKLIEQARRMPDLPPLCRRLWHSGVVFGDRLDIANQKTDNALGGANAQIRWCFTWYDRVQKAREPK